MRMQTALLATGLLLLLALAPWLVSSCAQRPLLPDELRQARTQYAARVEAAQAATMAAQRQGPSSRKVIALGTVAASALAATHTRTPLPAPTGIVTPTVVATQMATTPTRAPGSSTVVIVSSNVVTATVVPPLAITATAPPTNTPTVTVTTMISTRVIVIGANATPAAPVSGPLRGGNVPIVPGRPLGLVAIEDVITEEMLTAQMQQDASAAALSDLTVHLTSDGFSALGNFAIRPGFTRPVEMVANFAVENDSLVAQVTSIRFGGLDVTEQYASELEGRINWGLYQLLPERYVDSFTLGDGVVIVQSQMKPE